MEYVVDFIKLIFSLSFFWGLNRYASLYFCCAIEQNDNELLTLEIIHRYVELLDKYFGSVSNFLVQYKGNKPVFNLTKSIFNRYRWVFYAY